MRCSSEMSVGSISDEYTRGWRIRPPAWARGCRRLCLPLRATQRPSHAGNMPLDGTNLPHRKSTVRSRRPVGGSRRIVTARRDHAPPTRNLLCKDLATGYRRDEEIDVTGSTDDDNRTDLVSPMIVRLRKCRHCGHVAWRPDVRRRRIGDRVPSDRKTHYRGNATSRHSRRHRIRHHPTSDIRHPTFRHHPTSSDIRHSDISRHLRTGDARPRALALGMARLGLAIL